MSLLDRIPHWRLVKMATVLTALSPLVGAASPESNAAARDAAGPLAQQGAILYAVKCASCHGTRLEGGQHAPPLTGAAFRESWNQKTARNFYSRVLSTMPVNDPGSLAPEEVLRITLFCLATNGMKFNDEPANVAALNKLKLQWDK